MTAATFRPLFVHLDFRVKETTIFGYEDQENSFYVTVAVEVPNGVHLCITAQVSRSPSVSFRPRLSAWLRPKPSAMIYVVDYQPSRSSCGHGSGCSYPSRPPWRVLTVTSRTLHPMVDNLVNY